MTQFFFCRNQTWYTFLVRLSLFTVGLRLICPIQYKYCLGLYYVWRVWNIFNLIYRILQDGSVGIRSCDAAITVRISCYSAVLPNLGTFSEQRSRVLQYICDKLTRVIFFSYDGSIVFFLQIAIGCLNFILQNDFRLWSHLSPQQGRQFFMILNGS